MQTALYRIRHPIKAFSYWLAMRRAEKLFGPFGPKPF
jgi:hypothetical protein